MLEFIIEYREYLVPVWLLGVPFALAAIAAAKVNRSGSIAGTALTFIGVGLISFAVVCFTWLAFAGAFMGL